MWTGETGIWMGTMGGVARMHWQQERWKVFAAKRTKTFDGHQLCNSLSIPTAARRGCPATKEKEEDPSWTEALPRKAKNGNAASSHVRHRSVEEGPMNTGLIIVILKGHGRGHEQVDNTDRTRKHVIRSADWRNWSSWGL